MDRSLYLAYRPQTFAEVIEQDHVCRTLSNAIATDRLAHAYLFCGPRGTGKTSTARILAKSLNCEKGPTPEPCGECDNCARIRDGYTMDVVELDAASNRGIDEIRHLRETVQYAPAEGAYKLYIVDEAHQITRDAFNALLKTLEEPPSYVVFVLATTEPDRLPATILSRCQRFDFRRVSPENLAEHLKKVAANEGAEIDEAALYAIVRSADGAVRDGLTVLEQMLSFSEARITHEDVISALGFTETELLCELSRAVIEGNPADVIEVVGRVIDAGKDLHQLLKDLAAHFRDLLVLSVGADSPELRALTPEVRQEMEAQARKLDRARGVRTIDAICAAQGDLRWNPQHRLVVELGLLKAAEALPPTPSAPSAPLPAQRPASTSPPPSPRPQPAPPRSAPTTSSARPAPRPRPPQAEPEAPSPAPASEPPPPPPASGDLAVTAVRERWLEALAAVKKQSVPVHALLVDSTPMAVGDGVIVLGFNHQFHRDHCAEKANKQLVEATISQLFGAVQIDCRLWTEDDSAEPPPADPVSDVAAEPQADSPAPSGAGQPDPDALIRQAIDLFDGTILDQSST